MVNYKLGKFYILKSNQTAKVYVGSTCSTLRRRLTEHRAYHKQYLKGNYRYCSASEIVKYDDAYIELYEEFPCDSKKELHIREGLIIKELDLECVNKCIAGRNAAQYYIDNRERILERQKKYYHEHNDEYRQHYIKNRDKKRQYYIDNHAKIRKQQLIYQRAQRNLTE